MQVHEQYQQLCGKNMPKAALVIGGVSEKAQIESLRAGSPFVIATPGRLQDFITRKFANLRHVKILVLDEADRMLDMGFLPSIRRILQVVPEKRQTLVFLRNSRTIGGRAGERLHVRSRAGRSGLDAETGRERSAGGV